MSSRRNIVESALLERASLHAGHSYNSQSIGLRPVVAQAQNYQLQQAKGIHTFFPIERSKPTVLDTSNGLLPKGLCTYLCMCVCTYICVYLYEYVCGMFLLSFQTFGNINLVSFPAAAKQVGGSSRQSLTFRDTQVEDGLAPLRVHH